jgi:SARP family transcriptional regulator, regulator of embCAB operon
MPRARYVSQTRPVAAYGHTRDRLLGEVGAPADGLATVTAAQDVVPGIDVDPCQLCLLNRFRLMIRSREVSLPGESKRLLALVALHAGELPRAAIAGMLWPESSERRAQGSLRAAIFRLKRCAHGIIEVDPTSVWFPRTVSIDLRDAAVLAHQLLDRGRDPGFVPDVSEVIRALSAELLPGWYDEWLVEHVEWWRQLRLHGLEAHAARLVKEGRYGEAAAAAAAAVVADPLRESARAALIVVHRAEGNHSEAWREFDRYRALLVRELALEPTSRLRRLAGDVTCALAEW